MSSKSSTKATVLVVNGPNLNLLGTREPQVYGHESLADINRQLEQLASQHNIAMQFVQSNSEGALIDAIHAAKDRCDYLIINPAAYSHTSIALRDAILAVDIPCYEVHLSNIYQRESFRHHSYIADIANGTLSGFGSYGYTLALFAIIRQSDNNS